jgi:hypothetical protein
MKNTTKPFLLIAPLLGLFAVSCGDNFSPSNDATPFCYYAGLRYTMWQEWKAKDGCNICTCDKDSKVLCSKDLICSDGGRLGFETLPPADTSSDRAPTLEVLSDGDTATDQARDAAPVDVPFASDGKVSDAAVDSSTGDGRLASERD